MEDLVNTTNQRQVSQYRQTQFFADRKNGLKGRLPSNRKSKTQAIDWEGASRREEQVDPGTDSTDPTVSSK
jgi:hypothetical protein